MVVKMKYIALVVLFVLSSCGSLTLEQYIHDDDGIEIWAITDYYYYDERHEVLDDYYFGVNAITFKKSHECSIPIVYQEGWKREDSKGNWYVNEDLMELKIDSNNEYLNGTYHVCIDDTKKQHSLVLKSDSVKIILKRALNPREFKVKKDWKCND